MILPPPQPRSVIAAVDDDEDDIDLMRMLFRKAAIRNPFHVYQRGEEVIAALSALKDSAHPVLPLLCFLDVKMPAMNGHDILKWIRAQPELNGMPVVMLSSSEHPTDVERAAENGAQCYLAKYPQPAVLRQVIEEAERFVNGAPAGECFRLPANLLSHL